LTAWLLRPAVADDAAAAARVQIAGWRSAYRSIFPDAALDGAHAAEAAVKWRHRLAVPGAVAFVATAGNDTVEIAAGGPPGKEPRLEYPAEIYSLYLLADWRRRGIGRALIATMCSAFIARGADAAYLWCLAGNRAGRSFFASRGGMELTTAMRPSVGGLVRRSVAIAWPRQAMAAMQEGLASPMPHTRP